ncbi:hypothetical protein BURPS305_0012 [Burkholderia pseudomallei 305]|nr:hypothetical protein BURPS305_0012 [Burkholderia pseudomallei 305]
MAIMRAKNKAQRLYICQHAFIGLIEPINIKLAFNNNIFSHIEISFIITQLMTIIKTLLCGQQPIAPFEHAHILAKLTSINQKSKHSTTQDSHQQ